MTDTPGLSTPHRISTDEDRATAPSTHEVTRTDFDPTNHI